MMIIVPTHGRPHTVGELIDVFERTRAGIAEICFAWDTTDPCAEQYRTAVRGQPDWVRYVEGPSTNMGEALRAAAQRAVRYWHTDAVGFMGDDHRPRTFGWDASFMAAIQRRHIVYGNDTIQGVNLPTHVVMPAEIVKLIGRIVPDRLQHMYMDNYWKTLGETAGCLEYMGDVVIEHMHPIAGKAEWDEGYIRVNDGSMYATDAKSFTHHIESGQMEKEANLVRNWVNGGS
jgi:hypothetical protein